MYPDLKNMTAALNMHGIPTSHDPATGGAIGILWTPNTVNTRTGTRSHARAAYYDPIATSRPNLHLVTGHTVNKILLDKNLTATGVSVTPRSNGGGATFDIRADVEVILAAGAISTPRLLQLSGVGPRAVLEAAGVPLRLDLAAVGANFQDHAQAQATWNLTKGLSFPNPGSLATNATFNASAWEEYVNYHTGPYTVAFSNTAAFLPLRNFTTSASYAAVMDAAADQQEEESSLPPLYRTSPELLAGYRAQRAILLRHFGAPDAAAIEIPFTAAGFGSSVLTKPWSRGTVTLAPSAITIANNTTTSPAEVAPIVQYQAFAHAADRAVLLAAVRWTREFYRTSPILAEEYGPVELMPGAEAQTDDEIWDALVSASVVRPTNSHPSGTCAMMPASLGGCVGADLRVHGTRRLAVVDASVMPLIPGTHLQTTVYAVAEKAADIIKARSRHH